MTVKVERCKTGLELLDENILRGGVPRGNIVLVTGSSGVGKTTLCTQSLFNGAKKYDENGLLFTLTESVGELKRNMSQFTFYDEKLLDERKVLFLDMRSIYRQMGMDREQYTVSDTNAILRVIDDLIDEFKIKRIVIDSITAIAYRLSTKDRVRDFTFRMSNVMFDKGVTTFLTSEDVGEGRIYSREGIEYICDGIFYLRERELGNTLARTLQVVKMRGTSHQRNDYELVIDDNGVNLTERTFLRGVEW